MLYFPLSVPCTPQIGQQAGCPRDRSAQHVACRCPFDLTASKIPHQSTAFPLSLAPFPNNDATQQPLAEIGRHTEHFNVAPPSMLQRVARTAATHDDRRFGHEPGPADMLGRDVREAGPIMLWLMKVSVDMADQSSHMNSAANWMLHRHRLHV